MKILIVCSGTHGILSPFIKEQIDSLTKLSIEISLFQVNKKGLLGYLSHLFPLRRTIKQIKPDLIHAHYGLSGLLANMQRIVPVITTFHGTDINDIKILKYSKLAHRLSAASIFVEKSMMLNISNKENSYIIPCGVDTSVFNDISKHDASIILGLNSNCINILFSSTFSNPVKNYPLAKQACILAEKKKGEKINFIELKDYSRAQVSLLMNASDCILLTSFSEGSPQFIKEAMACNCPIVATDIGDISEIIGSTEGCFVTSFDQTDISDKILKALSFSKNIGKTKGRDRIIELGLDPENIAKKIVDIYKLVYANKE